MKENAPTSIQSLNFFVVELLTKRTADSDQRIRRDNGRYVFESGLVAFGWLDMSERVSNLKRLMNSSQCSWRYACILHRVFNLYLIFARSLNRYICDVNERPLGNSIDWRIVVYIDQTMANDCGSGRYLPAYPQRNADRLGLDSNNCRSNWRIGWRWGWNRVDC